MIFRGDLVGFPLIGLERGTRLGEAVRESFRQADADFQPTVEVRYCNTACVLASTGVGVAVVDPFSPRQGGHDLVVRPFTPCTTVSAYVLWSEQAAVESGEDVFETSAQREPESRRLRRRDRGSESRRFRGTRLSLPSMIKPVDVSLRPIIRKRLPAAGFPG